MRRSATARAGAASSWCGCRSRPGRGAAPAAAPARAQPAPGAARVLVVDDNVDAAEALGDAARAARTRGDARARRPRRARGGGRAPPELVLLDIGLPGMDGYAVAARLRERRHDRAALVALTGYGQDEHPRRSSEAGFDRHLVKPLDFEVLARSPLSSADGASDRRGKP